MPCAPTFRFVRHRADPGAHPPQWDTLVAQARNGTFLMRRSYMDYHADRFDDASWLVFNEDRLVAALPAHQEQRAEGSVLISHGGLTFGGLVLHSSLGAADTHALVAQLRDHLQQQGIQQLIYKPVPHILHRLPSEDDVHALHLLGARCTRMDLCHTVDLARRPALSKGRKHALSKARREGIEVRTGQPLAAFWAVLNEVLHTHHNTRPVHSLAEMQGLMQAHREIRLVTAHAGPAPEAPVLAGAVVYDYDGTVHTQYMASSEAGRQCGALDAVIASLIESAGPSHRWLSFGASTEQQGLVLNAGLAAQKEMFGARSTTLHTYTLDL